MREIALNNALGYIPRQEWVIYCHSNNSITKNTKHECHLVGTHHKRRISKTRSETIYDMTPCLKYTI